MVTIPTLETERLVLRPLKSEDFDSYAQIAADGEWSQFVGGPMDQGKAWRAMATLIGHWTLRGHGMFAVEEKSSGKFVGIIGHWNPINWPEPEIAYTLAQHAAGKGYATEAVRKMIDYTFNELKWNTVVSYIDDNNIPSQKVAQRVGAIAEDLIDLGGSPARVYRHPNPNN
ncbi:GNAT family N-acetyltransferase [Maritalea mediterranea]|uniref:GNAT family N-acetyltransferase n=1 Tax=Maritalea mediterranea TaxID=2909667 RepID=A0ABS9E274_9HYPH|nr:GNAT family N-acetyltransferase [Maritalea mediterranea]